MAGASGCWRRVDFPEHRAAVGDSEDRGLADVPYLDNRSVMELGEVPEHLVVLGGGYIGLEFGQLFRRLGSAVTIIQSGPSC